MSKKFFIKNQIVYNFLKVKNQKFLQVYKIIALNKTTALLQDVQSAFL